MKKWVRFHTKDGRMNKLGAIYIKQRSAKKKQAILFAATAFCRYNNH